MGGSQGIDYRTVAIAACLAIAILLVDIFLPLGVAGGVPYVAVILCGWWLPRDRWVLLLAVATSLLTATGYFLSQDGATLWVVLTNRLLALFAIWVTAALVIRAKKSDLALRTEQNDLERRVTERTEELAALNRDLEAENEQRRRSDAALQRSEARLLDFATVGSDWQWETDEHDCFTYTTDSPGVACGPTLRSRLGHSLWDTVREAPEDSRNGAGLRAAIEARRPFQDFRYSETRPDGTVVHWRLSGQPVFDEEGAFKGYRGVGKNETDAVEAWRLAERAERRLTGAIESLPHGFALYDAEDRLVLCNHTYVELIQPQGTEPPYGRTFEEILQRRIVDGHIEIAPEQREAWVADRIETHKRAAGRIEVHATDGRRYAVTEQRTPEGNIAVITTDVTERRKAEEALLESQALLKAIIDHAPTSIAIKDRDGRYVLVSPQLKKILGVSHTDVMGKTAHEIYPRKLADAVVAHDRAVLESGRSSEQELVIMHEDGPRTILNVKFPIPDAEGANASIGSIAIDITDRKRAEEALRDSEHMLSTLMRNLPGMAYSCRNVKTWSDEFTSTGSETLTGYPSEDLLNNKISYKEIIHPDDRDWVWSETQAALDEDRPFQYSYRIITKSGEEKWVWEQGSRVSESGCKPEILVGFITDITEQRRMQEHLRESDKLSALGQLASGVAHDFNNILMVINGYANLAMREPNNATKTLTALSRIVTAADKAAGLTKQLLAFGRRQAIERREIAVAGMLEEVRTLLAPLLGETIELRIDPAAEDLHVNTDSAQISQALVNLAINARDAMPGGGEIVIRTGIVEPGGTFYKRHPGTARGLHVAISVEDNGTGMDAATAARVFEPFFTTKERGKGTGLGLAMVYSFVQQSGGAVEIESETGAGTTVTIYLPALKRQPDVAEPRASEAESAHGETILMAEDDQDLRELTQLFLEDLGYTVLPAKNGIEALEIEAEHEGRIDLLLTDAVMPGCGGHELCQLFRESRPDTPVLMMSGYPTRGEFSNVKLPADIPFMQKPVDPENLARRLRELLDPQDVSTAEPATEPATEPALRDTA